MEEALSSAEQRTVSVQKQVVPQMSVGQWLITFLLLCIPLLNIIMLFIWAFDSTSARRNFSRAQLILMGIMMVLWICLIVLMLIFGMSSGIFSNFV